MMAATSPAGNGEVQPADDLGAILDDAGVKVSDFKHSSVFQ